MNIGKYQFQYQTTNMADIEGVIMGYEYNDEGIVTKVWPLDDIATELLDNYGEEFWAMEIENTI